MSHLADPEDIKVGKLADGSAASCSPLLDPSVPKTSRADAPPPPRPSFFVVAGGQFS